MVFWTLSVIVLFWGRQAELILLRFENLVLIQRGLLAQAFELSIFSARSQFNKYYAEFLLGASSAYISKM